MRRFLTLICLLCLAIPAGISFTGCTRNPDANYCNGEGFGLKITDVATITMQPQSFGISLAYGQTQQSTSPQAKTCQNNAAAVSGYNYGTTNNQLVDISPTGNICAGTWNRNTGGGIANYTICNFPDPLPSTNGLPYGIAYITASANSVTSNPVTVYVHPQVTSVSLVTEPAVGNAQQCFSQNTVATLDAQACFVGSGNKQYLLCAPPSVTATSNPGYACPLPAGVTSVLDCSASIGNLNYSVGTLSVASINTETNQITAAQPGTTIITASIAGGSSSAGYFSTCPPRSISVTLANGETKGIITQGVTQNLTTTIYDTNLKQCPVTGCPITGLTLDYQSTDPIDISTANGGAITTSFPGVASVYAICQPPTCNPAPSNLFGLYGTGLSVSSNPVNITVPGTASDYLWFGSPGLSQYVIPVELLSGSIGSTVRLPYVPNSMQMDRLGTNIYFGSSHELMVYNTGSNSVTKQDTGAPGVVLAVAPNNSLLLINDQLRQLFYLYTPTGGVVAAFGGVGNAAAWTPDAKTLYITDSAALNNTPENIAAGITGHTDTLYVYNANSGWSTYPLAASGTVLNPTGAQNLAITIPGVGAFLSGDPTVAHTWCPTGTVGNAASLLYYPQTPPDNSVDADTDVLAATTDGNHILGASLSGSNITLSDIGVTIPSLNCLPPDASPYYPLALGDPFSPLALTTTLSQAPVTANAAAVNQVVPSPNSDDLAFITYNPATTTNTTTLPYYLPGTGVGYVTLGGSLASWITAPIAGAFSPDNTYFFVSTAGDNMVHYINVQSLTDTQQISPNLPACTPVSAGGNDLGCTYTGSGTVVPATVIEVKPRAKT